MIYTETKFKDTKIGKVSEEWETSQLGKLVNVYDSKRVPLSQMQRINIKGTHPYCGANGIVDYIDKYLFDGEYILLAEDGGDYTPFGNSAYIMDGKFWVNNHAHVIQAIRGRATNRFLYYALNVTNLTRYIVGSTRKKLNQDKLKQIILPCPLLQEQRAITEILSTADNAIQTCDRIIAKTKRVKQGMMQKFFVEKIDADKFVELTNVFEVKSGTTPSTKKQSYWKNGVVNWFTPADLGKQYGKLVISESRRKITKEAVEKTGVTLLPAETLILSTRAPVGYVAILEKESTFNQGCRGLVPLNSAEVNPYYYAYFLKKKAYYLEKKAGQSTFKELRKNLLESFKIPNIGKNEQDNVAEVLLTIDKKLGLEKQRKAKFERIKQGLMSDLLTGKKRVVLT